MLKKIDTVQDDCRRYVTFDVLQQFTGDALAMKALQVAMLRIEALEKRIEQLETVNTKRK